MKVFVRTDASNSIGIGHIMRCLTLADSLANTGAVVRFVSRFHEGNLIDLVRERGYAVDVLPAPKRADAHPTNEDYVEWLGVSQEQDAAETVEAIGGAQPDWLVLDHYSLDIAWERMLRPHVGRLMVVEDLPQRRHNCDLVLDQNEIGTGATAWSQRISKGCQLALGPRYAMLRPEYRLRRATLSPHTGKLQRILVFYGGSDPHDLTCRTLDCLLAPEFSHLHVDIVIGDNYARRENLEHRVRARPNTHLFGPQAHLADLLATADLAIGAGGTTTWERMCMGVPSVVVCIAENQRAGCEQLAKENLIYYLGTWESVSCSDIAAAMRDALCMPKLLAEMSELGQRKVDGVGVARIREALDPTDVENLELRPASSSDLLLYFDWVNDSEVRRQSLDTESISLEQHRKWFMTRLATPSSKLFVLLARDLAVGQIRFDIENGQALVDYSIDSFFRGRGWGKQLISLGMRALDAGTMVRAEVKRANAASCAVFERLGFTERSASTDSELRVFHMDLN